MDIKRDLWELTLISIKTYLSKFLNRIDKNIKYYYYLWACNEWLSIRCNLGSATIALVSGLFILIFIQKLKSSEAGLILTYALGFSSNMMVILFINSLFFLVVH